MNKILPIILVVVFLQTPIMANTLPDDVEEIYLSNGKKVLRASCIILENCYTNIGETCKTQGYVVHEVKKSMSDFNRPDHLNRIQFNCGSIKK
jgi:hypothetical protein